MKSWDVPFSSSLEHFHPSQLLEIFIVGSISCLVGFFEELKFCRNSIYVSYLESTYFRCYLTFLLGLFWLFQMNSWNSLEETKSWCNLLNIFYIKNFLHEFPNELNQVWNLRIWNIPRRLVVTPLKNFSTWKWTIFHILLSRRKLNLCQEWWKFILGASIFRFRTRSENRVR